jgi:transcriptional regulator with XRE-family HTH domain
MPTHHSQRNTVDGRVIGVRLARVRKMRQLSQAELAQRATTLWQRDFPESPPISTVWISRVERGLSERVDLNRLTYVAHAMDVPVADLLPLKEIQPAAKHMISEADVAVCLRRYGLSEDGVLAVMDFIDYWKTTRPRIPRKSPDGWQ